MVSKIVLFIEKLSEKQILWILFGITFGMRLYSVLMARGISYDGAAYGFIARDFLKHDFAKGLSSALHPLYPFLIYLVSPDASHVEIAGRFISLFFGAITFIPVFYLAKEVAGQKGAVLSGLFYSIHAYLVTYSGMLLSEATYWGLLTLSVYFFWRGLSRKNILECMVSGACLGLSYLTRPEGIGYLILFFIWVFIEGGMREGWFKKCLMMGSLIVGFFIFAFPYMFTLRQETGQWLISKKGVVTQSQLMKWVEVNEAPKNEGGKDLRKEDLKSEKVIEQPTQSTKYFNLMERGSIILHYFPFTLYHYLRAYHFALWLFLFFGLIRVRQRRGKLELFLASLVLFHLFSLSTFTGSTIRYSIPLIPLSLFWAGTGVLEIQRYLQKIKISTPGKWVSFLIILAILVQLPQSMRPERRHRAEQKNVGLWLKENTPKDSIIMSNSPIETFYAEREFMLLPIGLPMLGIPGKSYREIIQFAKQKGIHYILTNKNTYERNPDFEGSIRSADLREFYRYKEKDGSWITVYEVLY
jgi:hypothetical protein